jgi:hypothetical protein
MILMPLGPIIVSLKKSWVKPVEDNRRDPSMIIASMKMVLLILLHLV